MSKPPFGGFSIPNTTPVPDIVFDELLSELTGNELKVLLYIIRRTYGFGKNADAISLSQFRRGIKTKDGKVLDKGCGIEHNRTILVALASLKKKSYVVANKGQTTSGDADTTVYKLHFKVAPEAMASNRVVTSGNDVVTSSNDGSYPRSPRSLPQVTTVVTPGNPQETVIQDTDSQETVIQEGTYGANAPTPADLSSEELHEKVDGAIIGVETVKRITDKHKAVYATNETPYHIAGAAIGNAEDEETPTEKREAVKIGATHGNDTTVHPGPGMGHNHGEHHPEAHEQITSEHTPGPGALPSAADPFFGRHGNTSDQAISVSPSLDSEPAQADFPPAGSAASGATTAQASGRRSPAPRRPKGKPAVLELTLAGMDVKSWYEQVRGKLRMTERNVNDCNALGECDGIGLESLKVYFEHVEALKWVKQYGVVIDLATAAGTTGNDKLQFLSFESNWPLVKKKLQIEQRKNSDDEVADDDYSPAGILKLHEQRERKQAQERGV